MRLHSFQSYREHDMLKRFRHLCASPSDPQRRFENSTSHSTYSIFGYATIILDFYSTGFLRDVPYPHTFRYLFRISSAGHHDKAYAMSNQSPRNCDLLRSLGRPERGLFSYQTCLSWKIPGTRGKNAGKNLSESSDRESNRRSFRYRSDQRGSFNHCTTQVGM